MDLQKEREAFESWWESFHNGRQIACDYVEENNSYSVGYANAQWVAWQAAKAQAVPEGFVLIKESDRDREICELIDERDHLEDQAEQLKDKLQNLYVVDFGEHSNCNFPFQNAIDFDDSDLVLVKNVRPDAIVHNQGLGLFKECQVIYGWDGKSKDFKDALNKGFYHGVKLGAKAVLETAKIEAQEQKG